MLILLAIAAAILITAIQFFTRSKERPASVFIKNAFLISLFSIASWKYLFGHEHFLLMDGYRTLDFAGFFFLALCVGFVILRVPFFCRKFHINMKSKSCSVLLKLGFSVLTFIGFLCIFITIWGKMEFDDLTVDQLIINLFLPATGANSVDFIKAFEGPFLNATVFTTILYLLVFSTPLPVCKTRHHSSAERQNGISRNWSLILAVAVLIGGLSYATYRYRLFDLCKTYLAKSTIIDDHYVDPRDVNLQFPEKKRNLIHIYLESMENSYMSKDLGGFMEENLIPELTELASEGYSFSHDDQNFGGPQAAVGTTWSVASMVNMSTGLPMKAPTERNAYGSKDNFLPGACSLGDILAQQGYEQTLMFGADADFGGLTYYFESHGGFKIMDYKYAKENGLIPSDYAVWWGFEDDKLFEFAKDEITRLSETGKPFHFVMETADTHRPDGYLSQYAPTPYENQYANVVAYSSAEVYKFVRWIQAQPFYENTTVVITGDHLSMETNFFEFYQFDEDYHRSQYNVILNPDPSVATKDHNILFNRQYANFDFFPTILSSMGVKVEGNRLGIGTDLFSGEKTLFEEFGFEEANSELEKKSVFYNEHILK